MFQAKTYEAVLAEIMSRAPAGIDLRQGSIYYDAVSGIAFKIAKYYADLEQILELVFLPTATGDYLTLRAEEHGVYRQQPSPAKYKASFTGTVPEPGTRFFVNGQYLRLMQDDEHGLYLEAETAGSAANDIPPGTAVVPVDAISGLTAASISEEIEPGSDEEGDENLRTRVQEKIAGPAENGNMQHYKTWCEEITGVGRARIVPLWNGPNTVKGVLIDTDGGPVSDAVADRVQEYIDPGGTGLGEGVANIGAHFTAVAASTFKVSISFSVTLSKGGVISEVQAAAEAALKEHIKEVNLNTSDNETATLRVSTVGNIIYALPGVLDYTGLRFNGQTANIELSSNEIFTIGEVTVIETHALP